MPLWASLLAMYALIYNKCNLKIIGAQGHGVKKSLHALRYPLAQ